MISDMEEKALSLLSEHRLQLDGIADALRVKETLDRNEVTAAIDAASAD